MPAHGGRRGGFTMVEMALVVAILGLLAAIAIPSVIGYRERLKVKQAVLDIEFIGAGVADFWTEFGVLPDDISFVKPLPVDPWGNPYEYLNLQSGDPGISGQRRRDKNMNPVNSDFDLYSRGPDGETSAQFTAAKGRDDIVRASDGAFIGSAEDY